MEYAVGKHTQSVSGRALGSLAWTSKYPEGSTHPVGQKEPNAWGLYDRCRFSNGAGIGSVGHSIKNRSGRTRKVSNASVGGLGIAMVGFQVSLEQLKSRPLSVQTMALGHSHHQMKISYIVH